jgi:hypothetical protein
MICVRSQIHASGNARYTAGTTASATVVARRSDASSAPRIGTITRTSASSDRPDNAASLSKSSLTAYSLARWRRQALQLGNHTPGSGG